MCRNLQRPSTWSSLKIWDDDRECHQKQNASVGKQKWIVIVAARFLTALLLLPSVTSELPRWKKSAGNGICHRIKSIFLPLNNQQQLLYTVYNIYVCMNAFSQVIFAKRQCQYWAILTLGWILLQLFLRLWWTTEEKTCLATLNFWFIMPCLSSAFEDLWMAEPHLKTSFSISFGSNNKVVLISIDVDRRGSPFLCVRVSEWM